MKVEDENARLRDLSVSDSDYTKIKDRRDNYKLYRQISLYTLGAMVLSAGIFYYLDIAQDDIAIAIHFPQPQNNYFINSNQLTDSYSQSMNNIFGLSITKSF